MELQVLKYIFGTSFRYISKFGEDAQFERRGGGGVTLPKNLKKERDGKFAEGQGRSKEGWDSVGKWGSVSLGIFPSWGVADVTIVIFNYILVIVFLFPLNVGVSPCFYCTVLVPVYRVYTSCFLNTVVSSCYRLHNSVCTMRVLLLVSV